MTLNHAAQILAESPSPDFPANHPTPDEWSQFFRDAPFLSRRTRFRYSCIFRRFAKNPESCGLFNLETIALANPRAALKTLILPTSRSSNQAKREALEPEVLPDVRETEREYINIARVANPMQFQALSENFPLLIGSGRTADVIASVKLGIGLWQYIEEQAPLEQTDVPINESRCAKLIRIPKCQFQTLVALRWKRDSVVSRIQAQQKFEACVLPHIQETLHVTTANDYAWLYDSIYTDPWVLAPNYGITLEDELRGNELSEEKRKEIIVTLRDIRHEMIMSGVVWAGFAPRNMFLIDNTVTLIDFEAVFDTSCDFIAAANALLWHRIFFADCLTPSELLFVFSTPIQEPPPDLVIEVDKFERILLWPAQTTTWLERKNLLEISVNIEGRHSRNGSFLQSSMLHGHQLGHFWGDFLPIETEVRLFKFLCIAVRDKDAKVLASLMEVLEAAMEADIIEWLLASAAGTAWKPDYTNRLVSLIESSNITELYVERCRIEKWYELLSREPSELCEKIIDALEERNWTSSVALDFIGSTDKFGHHKHVLFNAISAGLRFMEGSTRGDKFVRYQTPQQLQKQLSQPIPLSGSPINEVLAEFEEDIASASISQMDAKYFAFPDSGNSLAAITGALLGPMLNQNLIAFDRSAPAATLVEIQVIEWLRELIGYEAKSLADMRGLKDVGGMWTSGGHMSNHIAMLTALGAHFPQVKKNGLFALDAAPAVIMAGAIAHYSHPDAAFHLGLGLDNVIFAESSPEFTTSARNVEKILSAPPTGKKPFLVIGVAGNCRTTSIDDLQDLAEVCERFGVWLHVDACHGGSLLFSKTLRSNLLAGIHRADSVSIDPHKGLFTPYASSYLLVKSPETLQQFSRHENMAKADGCWDLGLIMPFVGSRGFDSLKTWFLFKNLGVDRIGRLVEKRQELMEYASHRLESTGFFTLFNDSDFYRTTFVVCPQSLRPYLHDLDETAKAKAVSTITQLTLKMNAELYESGELCMDEHALQDLGNRVGLGKDKKYSVLAMTIGNPLITRREVDAAINLLSTRAEFACLALRHALDHGESLASIRTSIGGPAGWSQS